MKVKYVLVGFGGIADEPVRRDELGVNHIRALFLAEQPERCVGHILHRGEQHGALPEIYWPYLHN